MFFRRPSLSSFCAVLLFGVILNIVSSIVIEKLTSAIELGEGPHWDSRTQKLFYVDLNGQKIMRYDPKTGRVTSAYMKHGHVGAVVPVEGNDHKFIVASGRKIYLVIWDGEHDTTEPKIVNLESLDTNKTNTRVNDGKCDPAGRFLIGTMALKINGHVQPNQGSLYSLDENLKLKTLYTPVSISNGLAWSSSNDTLYYIDSETYQVWAFDYDIDDGSLSNKRVVFDLKRHNIHGVPDGMTIDTNENLWVAVMFGGAVIQVDPRQGKLLRTIRLPAERISSVAFGGRKLDILYVTSTYDEMTTDEIKNSPHAGSLFSIKGLGVRGRPAVNFKLNRHPDSFFEHLIN